MMTSPPSVRSPATVIGSRASQPLGEGEGLDLTLTFLRQNANRRNG
jgi:hypothetical protein